VDTIKARLSAWQSGIGFLAAVAILLAIYRPTFQTIINGSSDLLMIDVGETQAVLNTWGTLHATGYPLYVLLSSLLVEAMTALSIDPATAASLTSLAWGIIALSLVYALAAHLSRRYVLAASITVMFGLTRFVWVHHVIAEIYSFTLIFQILLLVIALWRPPIRYRIAWLALVGGAGVAHHRTVILMAPALLYAVWPELKAEVRRKPLMIALWLLIGIIGFLPYLYLPLRANSEAAWVYGEPNTWRGFYDQFQGIEADRFFGLPESSSALHQNFDRINDLLVRDLTWPGIFVGLAGLGLGVYQPTRRRAAITFWLSGLAAYGFAAALYTDILASLILAVTLSLAFGVMFSLEEALALLHRALSQRLPTPRLSQLSQVGVILAATGYGVWSFQHNTDFIHDLTHDETGLETIALAEQTPPGATLMLAWGPRYFAVGFAQDVYHQLPGIRRVDHKGDFAPIVSRGMLVTPEYTFYNQPIQWWEQRLGTRIYLRAVGPYLVQIDARPALADPAALDLPAADPTIPVATLDYSLRCTADLLILEARWLATAAPTRNLSVFVHLLNADGVVIAQGDQFAPVYGWRPMTTWAANEIVSDVYPLPRRPAGEAIRFGLYEQLPDGSFQNYQVQSLAVACPQEK
jgi:hypothetical protein